MELFRLLYQKALFNPFVKLKATSKTQKSTFKNWLHHYRIRLASHVTRKTGQAGRDFSDNNKIKSTIYLCFYWCMNSTRRKFLSSLSKSMYSFVWFRRKNRLKCSWSKKKRFLSVKILFKALRYMENCWLMIPIFPV